MNCFGDTSSGHSLHPILQAIHKPKKIAVDYEFNWSLSWFYMNFTFLNLKVQSSSKVFVIGLQFISNSCCLLSCVVQMLPYNWETYWWTVCFILNVDSTDWFPPNLVIAIWSPCEPGVLEGIYYKMYSKVLQFGKVTNPWIRDHEVEVLRMQKRSSKWSWEAPYSLR